MLMNNRKGPFGCYAVETVASDVSLCEYAMAVINGADASCFLPCMINRYGEAKELSYDYSGLIPLSEFDSASLQEKIKFPKNLMSGNKLRLRRAAAGSFLLQIVSVLNNLLPPEGLVLSPKHIFTDKDGTVIKCCYRPRVYKDSKLRLSSIDKDDMESVINTEFFSQVLTEDEKQTILHSVSTGDEEMYCTCCKILLSDQGQGPGHNKHRHSGSLCTSGSWKERLSVRRDLIIPTAICLCAVYSYTSIGRKAAVVFVAAELILVLRIIYKDRVDAGQQRSSSKDNKLQKGQLRAKILFSQTPARNNDTEDLVSCNFSDCSDYDIHYASLKAAGPAADGGEPKRFSIYTDKVTIGSDRFLADIVVDDDSVDSQHASIIFDNDRYYLADLSSSHKTYIDDRALAPDRRYEIKNNQKLTFGSADFIFNISFTQGADCDQDIYG